MDRKGFLEALDKEGMLIYGTTYESNFKRLQALKKHRDTEDSIAKSLETIAECLLKQTEMAREAMKKSQELYEANMAMMKESQIKIEHEPIGLTKAQLKEIGDEEDDEDGMPF